MLKNAKFARYAITLLFIGFFFNFFYSGLQVDQLNVLTPYLAQTYGWSDFQITNPVTYGAVIGIILYLIIGALFVKFGVKKILIPCLVDSLSCSPCS